MARKPKKTTAKSRKKTEGKGKKTARNKATRSETKRVAAKAARKPAKRGSARTTAALPTLPAASLLVEDYVAILQLLNKYCHTVDYRSLDEIMELFHRDAVLIVRLAQEEVCEGHEAVRGWYTRWIDTIRSRVRYMRHRISAPVIEIIDNEANAICYLDGDSTSASNKTVVIQGQYDDTLIKENGHWLFKRRTISGFSTYALATTQMADPLGLKIPAAGVR
jgi:hypothetical protein